jgi:hypothetical protein
MVNKQDLRVSGEALEQDKGAWEKGNEWRKYYYFSHQDLAKIMLLHFSKFAN